MLLRPIIVVAKGFFVKAYQNKDTSYVLQKESYSFVRYFPDKLQATRGVH